MARFQPPFGPGTFEGGNKMIADAGDKALTALDELDNAKANLDRVRARLTERPAAIELERAEIKKALGRVRTRKPKPAK